MSLRVWLPLNGDLHNQGLSNITITPGSVTVQNDGKIGKCYCPATMTLTNLGTLSFNESSYCFWAKTSATTSWQLLMGIDNTNLSQIHAIYVADSSRYKLESHPSLNTSGVEIGKWHHYTFVVKNGESKVYYDGVLKETSTETVTDDTIGRLRLGVGTAISLNDVRVYDHCLSAKEVEEIAKGLVLHYKLDQGNPNLLSKYVTPGQAGPGSTASGGRTIYNGDYSIIIPASENADTYFRLFLTKQLTQGNTYTISCYVSGLLSGSSYNFPLFAQENTSMGILQLNHNGLCSLTFTMNSSAQNAVTAPDGSTVYVCFLDDSSRTLASGQGQIILSGFKLEEGNLVTPWSPANLSSIIYDSSGYSNNGTIVGSLETTTPSPRYSCATHFDGVTSCIKIPYNEINPDRIFTVNLWFYKDALGSKSYETLFGGPAGFEMDTRAGAATSLSLYMASTRGGNVYSPLNLNKWTMITMVRNGTNEFYYVNGELKKTIEAKPMPSGQYRIGAWASDTSQNYYGEISDFRIYATVLTAEQIADLYRTSMTIDNQGNIHARELVE